MTIRTGLLLLCMAVDAVSRTAFAQVENEYSSSTVVLQSAAHERFEFVTDVRWGAANAPKTLWLQGLSDLGISGLSDQMFRQVLPAFADRIAAGRLNVRVSVPWVPHPVSMASTCLPADREKWTFLSEIYSDPQFNRRDASSPGRVSPSFLMDKLRSLGGDQAADCYLAAQKHFEGKAKSRDPWPKAYDQTLRINPEGTWGYPRINVGTLIDGRRFCGADLRTKRPPTTEEIESFVRERL